MKTVFLTTSVETVSMTFSNLFIFLLPATYMNTVFTHKAMQYIKSVLMKATV